MTEKMLLLTLEKSNVSEIHRFKLFFSLFARLLYALDAYEDFEKDLEAKQFNALAKLFGESTFANHNKELVQRYLLSLGQELKSELALLIDDPNQSSFYQNQLLKNLAKRLGMDQPILCSTCAPITKTKKIIHVIWKKKEFAFISLPYPVLAQANNSEPGCCEQALGLACLFYCCCTEQGRSCCSKCCCGFGAGCCIGSSCC